MTTEIDDFGAMLAEDDGQKRAALEGSLARLLALRDQKKAIEEEISILEGPLRQYLELGGMPLIDGEHQIVASVKERQRPASIDLATMAKNPLHAAHIIEAARAGVLTASLTPLRAMKGRSEWADTLLRAEMPGGVTYTLVIEAAK